jgi:hypothetical protein
MAAAHHGEGVAMVEITAARQQRDGLFSGVDEFGVFLSCAGAGPMPRMPFSLCRNISRSGGR